MVSAYHDAHHRWIGCLLILISYTYHASFFSFLRTLCLLSLWLCYTRLRTVPWCLSCPVLSSSHSHIPQVQSSLVQRLFPFSPSFSPPSSLYSLPIPSGLARGGWDALVAGASAWAVPNQPLPLTALYPPLPNCQPEVKDTRILGIVLLCSQPDALSLSFETPFHIFTQLFTK